MKLKHPTRILHWIQLYQLYLEAFPIYERKPFSMIVSKMKEGKADVWYLEEGHHFAGLAFTLNNENDILLDYFAIAKKRRYQGLGSKALLALHEHYQHQHLFAEIESVYENVENKEERYLRKQFYLSNGMKELKIMANVFGTNMELVSYSEEITFERYLKLYVDNYGKRGLANIQSLPYPNIERNDALKSHGR